MRRGIKDEQSMQNYLCEYEFINPIFTNASL